MTIKSLQSTSLTNNIFYRSMLAGNDAYFPEFESDEFLEEVVLTSDTASITFSSLDYYAAEGFKHLQIRMVAICAAGFTSSGYVELNGDSTASYSFHRLEGNGSSVSTSGTANANYILINKMLPDNDFPNSFGVGVLDVLDFSSPYKNTTIRAFHGYYSDQNEQVYLSSGAYLNTDAITSLTIGAAGGNDMRASSRFSLYGSKG
jgi:hypothetical protein